MDISLILKTAMPSNIGKPTMLRRLIYTSFMLLPLFSFAEVTTLNKILNLKLNEPVPKGVASSALLKEGSYKIHTMDKKINSIRISFNEALVSEKFIDLNLKGHCLVQTEAGHSPLPRVYFFNTKNNKRYELNVQGKIKSVLIQEIPAAKNHPACTIKEAKKMLIPVNQVKKVKI
jgi:hypothetical protein